MSDEVKKAFSARMSEVFKKEGQNVKSFMEELKELSPNDKAWYCDQLNLAGHPTLDPMPATPANPTPAQ